MNKSQLTAGLLVCLTLVGAVIVSLTRYQRAEEALRSAETNYQAVMLENHGRQIASLEKQTALLIANNKTVQKQLTEETAKRQLAEAARAVEKLKSEAQIAQLAQELTEAKIPNVATLVSAWRPRVALVVCRTTLSNGVTSESRGSGVLITTSPSYQVATNRHVVTLGGTIADSCTIRFPEDPETSVSKAAAITLSSASEDWALITIQPTAALVSSNIRPAPRCDRRGQAGENILILGYPSIGARNDVTATEGIISGFEENYYIISAKVERGNSGGAAILTKDNCYLGMPTYVGAGQIEALARILDQAVIGR